jgi:uncharacterized protein YbaR (Trm112 family)
MVKDAYTVDMTHPGLSSEILAMLACPVCYGALIAAENRILCTQCGRRYPIEDGIPILLADRAEGGAISS